MTHLPVITSFPMTEKQVMVADTPFRDSAAAIASKAVVFV